MRQTLIATGIVYLLLTCSAYAQAWTSYISREDRFTTWFPGEPTISDTEWVDEIGRTRPARKYAAEWFGNTYTLIAVDISEADFTLRRGSYYYAAKVWREKGNVVYDAWAQLDRIPGHKLMMELDDGRRIYFSSFVEGDRLYILESNVSHNSPPPGQFDQGLQIFDEEGVRIRYSQTGQRIIRTDDLHETLGGPDYDGPILEGQSDEYYFPE